MRSCRGLVHNQGLFQKLSETQTALGVSAVFLFHNLLLLPCKLYGPRFTDDIHFDFTRIFEILLYF